MTDSKSILENALNLSPSEKLFIIEMLSKSLNEPDEKIDNLWKEEVELRYEAYKAGKIKSIPYQDILKK